MMKKTTLVFSMTILLLLSGMNLALAQEQPSGQEDTVNMDTDARPEFYSAAEDEKADVNGSGKVSSTTLILIIGAVVIVGAATFFLLKKKK